MRCWLSTRAVVATVITVLAVTASSGQALQRSARLAPADGQSTLDRLRLAAAHESSGELEAAERVVLEVLADNPMSLTALLRLERIMQLQGRLADLIPHVERLLEGDAGSVIGHQMRLRVLDSLDRPDGIAAAIATWSATTPRLETPYREGALIWRERGEHERAIALLEQGRRHIDRHDALALELGDAHAAAGDDRSAAAEWARAIGPDGGGLMLVQRRMQQLDDAGASVIPLLLERLSGDAATSGRRRAAVVLAIEAGLGDRAREIATDLVAGLEITERERVLIDVARRADGAGLHRLAMWAYAQLVDGSGVDAALAIRSRIAELALLTGDTALASEAYRELEHAAAVGSPQRRQAVALRIQLAARDGDHADAVSGLGEFRREFPQAPELDETAAAVAASQLAAGDEHAAEATLTGIRGVQAARLRGRLMMRRGDIDGARNELLSAAPLLQGAAATETIALAALLTRVSADGAELVAAVAAASDADRPARIRGAAERAMTMPARERSAVLEFLAESADRAGANEDADEIRRVIVRDLPRSHEAPAALLALALRAARGGSGAEARVLFEKLIMDYPRSALLPRARSELQQLGK